MQPLGVNDEARWIIETVKKDDFGDPTATLSVWNAALQRIRDHARGAEINSEVPDFVAGDPRSSGGHRPWSRTHRRDGQSAARKRSLRPALERISVESPLRGRG